MQQAVMLCGESHRFLQLPDPDEFVVPGIRWERHECALTPAFWATQVWMTGSVPPERFRLGRTLAEEVVSCILGGYGIPAEVGLAAFERVAAAMRNCAPELLTQQQIEGLLADPLDISGRQVRYRFARQRAGYLAAALSFIRGLDADNLSDIGLRDALLNIPGVGYKTASWVVRNFRASDDVAILDIHIIRAGRIIGIFPDHANPSTQYLKLERTFLEFATALGVRASVLDAVIWATMRSLEPSQIRFLVDGDTPIAKAGVGPRRGAPDVRSRSRKRGQQKPQDYGPLFETA